MDISGDTLAWATTDEVVIYDQEGADWTLDTRLELSGHLALVALFLVLTDLPRVTAALLTDLPSMPSVRQPFWAGRWRRGRVAALHTVFVNALTATPVTSRARSSRGRERRNSAVDPAAWEAGPDSGGR